MSMEQPSPYTLLEHSFRASPDFQAHKPLPRAREELRSIFPATAPLHQDAFSADDESLSNATTHDHTPLASPAPLSTAESCLPPTPPSRSSDERPAATFSTPAHVDGVVSSLMSRKSSLSTPVNQRSPPTPDPSPPRPTASLKPERPAPIAYPSSRADSFKTAREDQYSTDGSDSRASTPLGDRLSKVSEEPSLGLAFERDDHDITPTNQIVDPFTEREVHGSDEQGKYSPLQFQEVPDREWDTELMRNVTVRRRRNSKPSPKKNPDAGRVGSPNVGTRARRSSSLRERVEASKNSPRTPSIENFAQSIGWPSDEKSKDMPGGMHDAHDKRHSTSSATSTIVQAVVVATPPQKQRALRHSGRNLAYRADGSSRSDLSPSSFSNRSSLHSDEIPLHRLIHKRASINDRKQRISSDSRVSMLDRTASPQSLRQRHQETAAYTLAHQESVRRVLQPAADILSRSNTLARSRAPERTLHKRISSAPEATREARAPPSKPYTFLEMQSSESQASTPASTSYRLISDHVPTRPSAASTARTPPVSPRLYAKVPASPHLKDDIDTNKSLPDLPIQSTDELMTGQDLPRDSMDTDAGEASFHDALPEQIVGEHSSPARRPIPHFHNSPRQHDLDNEALLSTQRGSFPHRGGSDERRRSSLSQDHTSTSQDTILRPSLDRVSTEEVPRRSIEWRSLHADDHPQRSSFDRSTSRSEEHAMARHLYSQSTPFSQFSDTPIEVSEATAVSIFPHNNDSLLVVQHISRSNTLQLEDDDIPEDESLPWGDAEASQAATTALRTDTGGDHLDQKQMTNQPTLTFEPATPPTQIQLPVPGTVDSPLINPRAAPEPPIIKFIPPTPADELDMQLGPTPPGPPKRSDSHPQRRLSLAQRARRYSDNFITPLLTRASSTRSRASVDLASQSKSRIPTVNDDDGALHPFWRPRGFWDDLSDSESDDEDDVLPQGGDTSDVPDPEPEPSPRRITTLSRRLTNGLKTPGGFLIGNSLGVERSGTNRRRPQITLPSRLSNISNRASRPRILLQAPTFPTSSRIEKRGPASSMHSSNSYERPRRGSRRDAWRQGKFVPGLKGVQVQYIGLSGVKERLRERKAEKRRERLRRSIGSRYFVEDGMGTV